MLEPLSSAEARKRIRGILEAGEVVFSTHALDEMAKDGLEIVDARNVLKGGVVEPAELERGTWRYRVKTSRMCAVVAFRSEQRLVIVTMWRNK